MGATLSRFQAKPKPKPKPSSPLTSYNVFHAIYFFQPQHQHAIFVETGGDGLGWEYQVRGGRDKEMSYVSRMEYKPKPSSWFTMELIGTVSVEKFWEISATCEAIPPPKQQFRGNRRLDPDEPLRGCKEWTEEVIQALKENGIFES